MGVLPAVPDAKTGPSVCQAKGVREGATRSPGSDYRLLLSFVLRLSLEGLNHLRMQFKGLEGVFHVRELGLVWSPAALCPRTGPRFETAGGSRGPHRALGGTVGRAADRRNHGRRPTSIRRGSTRVKRTVCRPLRRPVVQPHHVRGIIDPLTIRIEDLAEMDRSSRTYRLAEDVLLGRDVDCATHIGAWRNKELEPFL